MSKTPLRSAADTYVAARNHYEETEQNLFDEFVKRCGSKRAAARRLKISAENFCRYTTGRGPLTKALMTKILAASVMIFCEEDFNQFQKD